jgi:hypothetical protein
VFSINNKAFSAEAKQIWPTLTSNFKSIIDNVNKSLYISCKEALKLKRQANTRLERTESLPGFGFLKAVQAMS